MLVYERHLELLDGTSRGSIEKALGLGRVLARGAQGPRARDHGLREGALDIDPEQRRGARGARRAPRSERARPTAPSTRSRHWPRRRRRRRARSRPVHPRRAAPRVARRPGRRHRALQAGGRREPEGPFDLDDPARGLRRARRRERGRAELLEQEIKQTEGRVARAKLAGEMAALYRDRVRQRRPRGVLGEGGARRRIRRTSTRCASWATSRSKPAASSRRRATTSRSANRTDALDPARRRARAVRVHRVPREERLAEEGASTSASAARSVAPDDDEVLSQGRRAGLRARGAPALLRASTGSSCTATGSSRRLGAPHAALPPRRVRAPRGRPQRGDRPARGGRWTSTRR